MIEQCPKCKQECGKIFLKALLPSVEDYRWACICKCGNIFGTAWIPLGPSISDIVSAQSMTAPVKGVFKFEYKGSEEESDE